MRILLLCHYFAPEPGAPQARLLETAREFRRAGHRVTVVTAFPHHPDGVLARGDRGRVFRRDRMEGIEVLRSLVHATPNRGFGRKVLGHLSFMATAFLVGGARARRPDVVVVSSPTFFSVLSAFALSLRWRVPYVFEVRDLWPAIFTELGVLTSRPVIRALEALEMFLYRRAARVVTVTEGFREILVSRGLPPERVATITNGVDVGRFRPAADRPGLRARLGLGGEFVVLYLGAHGISHALGRVLEVAERWRGEPARFVFVGDGAEKPALVAEARRRGLGNVEFRDPVPKERVPDWYGAADVGLVPLRDVPLFRTFIPSKLFELLACGLPVLGSVAGEAAEILRRSGGARVVPPEDVDAMDRALRDLRDDPGGRAAMGAAGARFVRGSYDRADLARRYLGILEAVAGGGR